MSDNVDAVKRVVDAINRADVDAVAESVSDDFALDFSNSRGPMNGIYHGPDGVREFMTSFFEPWESIEFRPRETPVELDDRRVLTVNDLHGRGHESGVEVTATGATIWTVRDGRVAAVKLYQSKEEALEAAVS